MSIISESSDGLIVNLLSIFFSSELIYANEMTMIIKILKN